MLRRTRRSAQSLDITKGCIMGTVKAWINPLMCPEIDAKREVTAGALLDYLFTPECARTLQEFESRYLDLRPHASLLPLAPAEANILQKIIWPLRSARGSYALGHSLSCIAMAGMVGEMVAVLLWDITRPSINGPLTEDRERMLMGRTFEKLGQERRVDVLVSLGILKDDQVNAFTELKAIRNRYLHLLSHTHDNVDTDARRAFECAAKAVQLLFTAHFENGDVILRPELSRYLESIGVLNP